MHVKYIVYYTDSSPIPFVDIWKTNGDLLHLMYAAMHNIDSQNISSCGDLVFNFFKNRWDLQHWQVDGAPFDGKLKKRDKALVQKKIYQTEFLKDDNLRRQCRKLSLFRRIFQYN